MNSTERKRLLDSYKTAHARLISTLSLLPKEMWQYKPGPSEWSIHEILVHLADSEANLYIRARRFIAEPGSKVLAFNHDRWTQMLGYHTQNAETALELFRCLRELTYELLKNQPVEVWGNTVEHSEYGTMILDQWLERADKHANDHIKQIGSNYELWLKRKQ